jgi:hypothetical protein
MSQAGFGFVECGTVTPLAQAGNPRPRLFRLTQDQAVINRMGFNNEGLEPFAARLSALKARRVSGNRPVVGANIGANKDAADRIADYVTGLTRLWGLSDYFTVNISSPNTPGLRALQTKAALEELLGRVAEARGLLKAAGTVDYPIFPEGRARPGGRRGRGHRRHGLGQRPERHHRQQHHHRPARPPGLAPQGRERGPVRKAAAGRLNRHAGALPRGQSQPSGADRRGRDRQRRRRPGQDPRRSLRRAAVFGPGLWRARPGPAHQARPGDPAARIVVSKRRDEIGRAEAELDICRPTCWPPCLQGSPGRLGRGGGQDQSRPAQHADQRPDGVRPPGRPGRSQGGPGPAAPGAGPGPRHHSGLGRHGLRQVQGAGAR